MDEVFMIEELVLLRSHEVAIEPEQRAERHGVVSFDRLERRLKALELARRADEKTGFGGQILGEQSGLQVASSLVFRHRVPRDESPETWCAAASARPAWCGRAARPWPCCPSCNCRHRRRSSRSRARARCESQDATRLAALCR